MYGSAVKFCHRENVGYTTFKPAIQRNDFVKIDMNKMYKDNG